jgi:biopolymer transport protein ExbD
MAGTSASSRGRGGIVGINVTPMVDIVLVLLVIMMVSATYIVSQSLQVELPKTGTSDDSVSSPATVTLTKDGARYFNGERVSEAQLRQQLAAVYAKNNDLDLIVSADADASHGAVVHVIDLAKAIGIAKFAINVERKK